MDSSEPTATASPTAAASASASTAATSSSTPANREGSPDTEAPPTLNQIRYPCLTNMDYHAAREAWLDGTHRWLMFLVIAAGASVFVDAWPLMRIAGPIVAVVCGALDLTFDLSNRARSHAMFRRRYSEILSEASREPENLVKAQCKIDELGGEEEPPFNAQLALSAMRGQQATYGRIHDPCRPQFIYRCLANAWRFSGHDFNESPTEP